MKKGLILFLFALILFGIFAVSFIHAIEYSDVSGQVDDTQQQIENVTSQFENKWDYLQKEWKSMLLKNKFVFAVDSFFTKINIAFLVLFAEDYSLVSLTLWLVIILWILFAVIIMNALKAQLGLDSGISFLIGAAVSVILSQIKIFHILVTFILKIAFAPDLWYVRLIIWIFIFIGFFAVYYVSKILDKYLEKARKLSAEKETAHRQKKLEKFTEGAGI